MTDAPEWNGKTYVPEEWTPLSGKFALENMFTGERMPYQDAFKLLHEYENHLPEERKRRIQIVRENAGKARNFELYEPVMYEVWRLLYPAGEGKPRAYEEIAADLKAFSKQCPTSHRSEYVGEEGYTE